MSSHEHPAADPVSSQTESSMQPAVTHLRQQLGRIALCHEWITGAYGSDLTAAAIAQVLGIRDVFTLVAEPTVVAQLFEHPVKESWLARLPEARRRWDVYFPLWLLAWRSVRLREYETVITSSHAFVNAVRLPPGASHICYCYTPMRYAWAWREELGRVPLVLRPFWPAIASLLREIDRRLSRRPTAYIAISRFVQRRIRLAYGRSSTVCYPPVDTDFFTPSDTPKEEFYLCAGRLVAYKRTVDAVLAATHLGRRLIVAGKGPELGRLRRLATGANIEFRTEVSGPEMRDLMRRTRALIFPGVEDFGIVVAEAQAAGTPVIARGLGGATETVKDGETGILYEGQGSRPLAAAIRRFEKGPSLQSRDMRRNAEQFSRSSFPQRLARAISEALGSG